MDDVEYILRLVLKARDDMAAVLRKARTEIRGFATDANSMNSALTNLNAAMDKFDTNLHGITEKLQAWRATLRDVNKDGKDIAKTFDTVGKNAETSSKKVGQAVKAQGDLIKAADRLRNEYVKLAKQEDINDKNRDYTVLKLKEIGNSLDSLAKKVQDPTVGKFWARWAKESRAAAEEIIDDQRRISRALEAEENKVLAKQKEHEAALIKIAENAQKTADKNFRLREQGAKKAALAEITEQERVASAIQKLADKGERIRELGAKNAAQRAADAEINQQERIAARVQQLTDKNVRIRELGAVKAAKADAQAATDARKAQEEIVRLAERSAAIQERITTRKKGADRSEDISELKLLTSAYSRLSRDVNRSEDDQRRFGAEAERLNATMRAQRQDVDRSGSTFSKLAASIKNSGDSIAGFDNQARGLGILLAVASFQQLTSAAIALGGELVSLAGSAIMAGGALGGILAAGAAQALPVIGLLAGAASRVKSVFDAFQQSQLLQKAQFADAEKGAQKQIDKTNQLANAQDSATAAAESLTDARKALTQAQKDGVDQLEDLIYQEKQAALAAKGASLNVKEAQKALQDAITGGASALEIQQRQQQLDEARLSRGRSRTTARRATRDRVAAGGDVGNLPNVQAAEKAVENAERAVERTSRALDVAADKTDRLASSTMTAQANLNFLLSQLSPAERKLYTAFSGLYTNYKRIFSGTSKKDGIYGVIIDSFTRAVEGVDALLKKPDVVNAVSDLAGEIGTQLNKIFDSFTTGDTLDQLIGFVKDAKENLGPVVDMAIDLGHAFVNIADTASPAFQKFLEFLGPIVDKFLALTEDKDKMEDFFNTGEEHLESWINLFLSIIDLFATLAGASADSGKTSIEDLTETIKGWTDWLDDHHDDVVGFFEDSRDAAYAIAGVVENLAVTLFNAFDSERVKNFAGILNDVVIPALASVIDFFGWLIDKVATFVDNPVGAEFAKWAIALAIGGKVASALFGIFGKLVGVVEKVGKALKFLQFDKLLKLMRVLIPASGEGAAAGAVALNPVVLVIAAITAAVVGLLAYFGKLDDVWRGIKDAFQIFSDAIKPALDNLNEALGGAEGKAKILHGVFVALKIVGQFLADFIASVLISIFKSFAHVVGGVVGIVISYIASVIKYIHGIIDIWIGLFKLLTGQEGGFDQIKKGFGEIIDAFIGLAEGILEGIKNIFLGLVDIFIAPFKAAWDAVKGFFGVDSPSKLAAELGEAIIDGIVAGAKGAAKALGRLAGWVWDKIKDGFHAITGAYKRLASWLIDKWLDFLKAELRGLKRIGNWIWDAIKDSVRAAGHLAKAIAEWVWDKWTGYIKRAISGWKAIGTWIFNALSDAIHGIGSKLEDIGSRIIKAIVKGIKSVPNVIKEAVDWLISKIPGAKTLLKVAAEAGDIIGGGDHFAEGGPVPGSGNGDTVLAKLTPGEHVLTKSEVAAAGGHAAIFALRRMLGGGGQGGPFGYQPGGAVRQGLGDFRTTATYDPLSSIDYTAAAKRAAEARKKEADERKKDLATQREDYHKSSDERAEATRAMWQDMLITTRRFANDIEKQVRDMRVNTSRSIDRASRDITGSWTATWKSLMQVTYDGLKYIGHQTNNALEALGEKRIDFNLTAPATPAAPQENLGGTGHLATGGIIGNKGERGRDAGLYPLGRGEAVLNWAHQGYIEPAMNAFYGHGLGEMFNRVRGYHAGGPGQFGFAAGGGPNFGGHPVNVIPGIAKLIELLQKKFPLLQVTSTTDHGFRTSTGGISDHTTGHAVDLGSTIPYMARVVSFINSSGLWKRLKQGIHNPGLAVNQGERVDGPGFFSVAWPQHIDHIHLALTGALGAVAAGAGEILRRIVTPRGTATAKLVQAALDRVRKSAGLKVASSGGGDAESMGGDVTATGANAAEKVFNFFTGHGLSQAIAAGFAGTFQKESNFNTSVLNARGSGAQGLAQWLGGRLTKLKQKKNWQSLQTQLDYVWEELHSTESGAFQAIKTAKSPAEAARIIDSRYERSDAILSAPAYAEAWYKRFAKGMASGGQIFGPDGSPVPILAHAGEWILNKGQQARAAMLSGLSVSGLRSLLGFHGGPDGAAGGTQVKPIPVPPVTTFASLMEDVADTWKGIIEIAKVMKRIRTDKIKKGDQGKIGKAYQEMVTLIDNIIGENGVGAIATEINNNISRAATKLKQAAFKIGPGGVVSRAFELNSVGALTSELATMGETLNGLFAEKGVISEGMKKVDQEIARVNLSVKHGTITKKRGQSLINQLTASRNKLITEQDRIDGEIADATEAKYQKQIDVQQAILDDINKRHEDTQSGLDLRKQIATFLGTEGVVDSINQQAIDDMRAQAADIAAALPGMAAAGATDLFKSTKKGLDELYAKIDEKVAEKIREAVDVIEKSSARERGALDLVGRMADAVGVIGNKIAEVPAFQFAGRAIGGVAARTRTGIAEGQRDIDTRERARIAGELVKVDPANLALTQELTDKINELTVKIAEDTKAVLDAKIASINSTHDNVLSMADLELQLVDLDGQIGGQVDLTKKKNLLDQKNLELVAKGNELTALLTEATPGTQAYVDLQRAIKENEIATKQNTVALNEVTGAGSAPSTFASTLWQWLGEALFTGTGGIMQRYTPPGGVVTGPGGVIGMASTTNNNNGTNLNIEINEAGQPIDPTKLAGTIVFATSTAQN